VRILYVVKTQRHASGDPATYATKPLPRLLHVLYSTLIMLAVLLSWWRSACLAAVPAPAGTHFPVGSIGLHLVAIIVGAAQG
jgi:hypothetical protein